MGIVKTQLKIQFEDFGIGRVLLIVMMLFKSSHKQILLTLFENRNKKVTGNASYKKLYEHLGSGCGTHLLLLQVFI